MSPAIPLALLAAMLELARGADFPAPDAVKDTLRYATIHFQVGPLEAPLTPEAAGFLLEHPGVASCLVLDHKIAPYRISTIGPRRYRADDGRGTRGSLSLVDAKERLWVYYAEGAHESGVFPEIRAAAVVRVDLRTVYQPPCRPSVRASFDVHVRLLHPVVAAVARVLRPFVQATIVRKFDKAFAAARATGLLIAREPHALFPEMAACPDLPAEEGPALSRVAEAFGEEPAQCR